MEPPPEEDQAAGTQTGPIISQAATIPDTNGANLSKPTATTESSPLTTADLVKILEIALTEIRANQTFAFSVLGFAAVGGTIIQKTHFEGSHSDISPLLWVIGILFCVGAAIWTAGSKHHLTPLGLFVKASGPGEPELVLGDLRSALNKANNAVIKARGPKMLVCIGVVFIVIAVGVEFWKCITTPNTNNQKSNRATAEQKQ